MTPALSKVKLRRILEERSGITWGAEQESKTPVAGALPVLTVTNVQDTLEMEPMLYIRGVSERDRERKAAKQGWTIAVGSNGNRARIGNCVFIERDTEYLFASFLVAFRPSSDSGIDPEYFYRWMSSYEIQARLSASSEGTTGLGNLSTRYLRNLWISYPTDSREQARVVELLRLVDSAIAAARESVAKTERVQKGLMQQLLTGRLRPNGTVRRTSDFTADGHFGRLPHGWQSVRVKNLISSCEYGLSRAMSEHGHYPIFRMNNIERGRMVGSPLAYIDLSPKDFARYRVRKGDILFNRTNTVELVGKVGIFALEGDFVFASYLVRLVASEENDPRFLNYYLNSFEGQKRIAAKVTPSIGQANINTRSLKSVWAVKPSRSEQSVIADRLDAFFDLIIAKEEKIAALQKLKKSLMQHLLTGRIRLPVPKDGK